MVYYLAFCIALITLFVLLSALAFCSDTTAHIAAGSQPIKVICRIRHNSPERIFPLRKKDSGGISMARSIITDYKLLKVSISSYTNLIIYL